uniref:Uncharacterized protein n=1 Tax=Tobacco rattle virus TaxID=12295 RepID=A0A0E3M2J9_9VIRU|nr:hypothetical protein [Tobacco rattle virus]
MSTFTSLSVALDEGTASFGFKFTNYSYWGAYYKNSIDTVDGMHDTWNNDYFTDHAPTDGLYLTLYCKNPGGRCEVSAGVHYNGEEITNSFLIQVDGVEYTLVDMDTLLFTWTDPGTGVHDVKVFVKYVDLAQAPLLVLGVNLNAVKRFADLLPNILDDSEIERFLQRVAAEPKDWQDYMIGSLPLFLKKRGLEDLLAPLVANPGTDEAVLAVLGPGAGMVGLVWLGWMIYNKLSEGKKKRASEMLNSDKLLGIRHAMTNCVAASTNFFLSPANEGRLRAWKRMRTPEAFARYVKKNSYSSDSFHPFFNPDGWLNVGFGSKVF